jgi:hypothetical protein
MIKHLVSLIKARSKTEWRQYFKMQVEQLRRYIQDNGERAAVVGFIVGVTIVIFLKFVIVLAVLTLIAYQTMIIVADE